MYCHSASAFADMALVLPSDNLSLLYVPLMAFSAWQPANVQLALCVHAITLLLKQLPTNTCNQCKNIGTNPAIILISLSSACHPTTLLLLLLPLPQLPCTYHFRIAIQHFISLIIMLFWQLPDICCS